uniref:Uncharacterized protein n=1 Tax=Eptatretus burgeri TaxID=7764 RepID=A0A8C4R3N6_EPTBU
MFCRLQCWLFLCIVMVGLVLFNGSMVACTQPPIPRPPPDQATFEQKARYLAAMQHYINAITRQRYKRKIKEDDRKDNERKRKRKK